MPALSKKTWSTTIKNISGVSVESLAKKHGTPTYVYDAETIRDQVEKLRAFDVIRYAQKANSNLAILSLMRQLSVKVDAVSLGEIMRAKAAGYTTGPGDDSIVYTADIFDRDTLDIIGSEHIHTNIGSIDMIEQLGERFPGREITLRINPGFGHGHSQKTNTGGPSSKHGIWHEELPAALEVAQKYHLCVSGLHMHIGSGTDFEHLAEVCGAMEKAAAVVGSSLTTVSAGGGLPTPYRDSDSELNVDRYFELWDATRKSLELATGKSIQLEIEPGRFPVAESGFLITEIRAIKNMGDNRFYLVDAGFNNLARPILYGAFHPMAICAADGREIAQKSEVVVGGPLCESGDIFTQAEGGIVQRRELPTAAVGDFLVIGCAGAYGFVMSSNYNSKSIAAEVLVDSGTDYLIRHRQAIEDMYRLDVIPKDLA